MTQTTATSNAAWGLELSHTGAYLVRWELASAGASAQHRRTFPIGDFWQTGVLDAELLSALGQIPQAEPLGVCFPDQAMLCRGFSLPRAQANVMEKMVHAQMEALLSAGPERLTSSWQAFPDPLNAGMQWVLFCAGRREVLERLNAAIPPGVALRAVLPRALATAHSWPRNASSSELLVEVTHEAATMSLVADGHLLRCMVLGLDDAPETESSGSPGAQSWVRQSRQSYHSLLEGLPRDRWPRQGLIRGTNGEAAEMLPTLADALGVDLHPWSSAPDAAKHETTSPYLGAEGIARLIVDDPAALHINFARPAKALAAPVVIRHCRVMVLALACLAGVALLYGIDCYRSSWLSEQVEQVRAAAASSGGIEQRLAIDRYLEKNVSPAMPGLDAILAAAPPSLSMTSFSLTAGGQFRFVGALGSPNEVDDFLRKLLASKALANVEVRSLRNDQQRWTLELSADAAPAAGMLLITAPAKQAANLPVPGNSARGPIPAATAPATGPTKRGGV